VGVRLKIALNNNAIIAIAGEVFMIALLSDRRGQWTIIPEA
jgi:hypothetical protein